MARRRHRRKISEKERQELCRDSRNRERRNKYAQKHRLAFFSAYADICKKYGCYIEGNLKHIRKITEEDRPGTINRHLGNMASSVEDYK